MSVSTTVENILAKMVEQRAVYWYLWIECYYIEHGTTAECILYDILD